MHLNTFVERMRGYDFDQDKEHIIEDLQHLARHRTLLSEHLCSTIKKDGFSTRNSLYGPYGYVLHHEALFSLRLGIWSPIRSADESGSIMYGVNHSHDVEIYAVGYCGDGYTTIIRDILEPGPLRAGIKPSLGEARSMKLAPGQVLHMAPFYQIHRQLPPDQLSASLSLVIHRPPTTSLEHAWCFDENYIPTCPGTATQETAFLENALSLLHRG
ncbi:transposase [Pseudomonas alkylphenolica]|uniref:transposase n=1 Tax=Pseudomonas alkylphenolica TaxID=237609 RepID=UPI00339435E4